MADAETCINWYVENMESDGARSKATLYDRPGLTNPIATLPDSPVRGMLNINERLFAVGGTKFCEILSDGTVTSLGIVGNDGQPVSMVASDTQVFIVSAGLGYSFNLTTNTFAAVTIASTGAALTIQTAPNGLWIVDNVAVDGTVTYQIAISIAADTPVTLSVGQTITIAGATDTNFNHDWIVESSSKIFTGGDHYYYLILATPSSALVTAATNKPAPDAPSLENSTGPFSGSAGPNSPSAAANDSSVGGVAWNTPTGALTIGGGSASDVLLASSGITQYLKVTGFGFSIPGGATIKGIVVNALVKGNYGSSISDYSVRLYKAGVMTGSDLRNGLLWDASYGYQTYGSGAELWGTSWTSTDINDAGFGVGLMAANYYPANRTAYVDYISIEVFYSTTGTTGTLTPGNTYTYKLTMVNPLGGETVASSTTALLATGSAINVVFPNTIPVGFGVNVYGRTGTQLKVATVAAGTTHWVDTGSVTPSGAAPTASGGGTLTPNTTVSLPAIQAAYCDGYFLRLLPERRQWGISSLFDCTSWSTADVTGENEFPDDIITILVDHREVIVGGRSKTVIYSNSGNSLFTFEVVPGGYIEQGCDSQWGPVRLDNSVFWLGHDERGALIAWRAQGYLPVRVSNYAVEQEWQQYDKTSDVISYAYQWMGHAFWHIYFPAQDVTWVFDAALGLWHREGFWTGSAYTAHRSQCHSYVFGKHLVGDWSTGNIYQMSPNIHQDFGNAIRRERRAPYIGTELEWMQHERLQIDAELTGGTLSVRWSDDGVNSWSNSYTIDCSAATGKFRPPPLRRLGGSRHRVYEITSTSNKAMHLIDGYVDATGFTPVERLMKNLAKMA
jgi:hypothetical protein